mgnify:CR=1 FL=1
MQRRKGKEPISFKKTIAILGIAALVIGGAVSLAASSNPDGLEWSMERLTGSTELETTEPAHIDSGGRNSGKTALLPDYGFKIPIPRLEPAFPELRDPQLFLLSVSVHAMHSVSLKRKSHKLHGTGERNE